MADDRRVVEFERVEDVVDQLVRVLADVTGSIGAGIREPVTGKVDREQSVARQRGEQGRPRRGAEGPAVEQN